MDESDFHLNKTEFLACYCISEEQFGKTGLDWSMLETIGARHTANLSELHATADYISQRLRQLQEVHSLKVRVKHPEHLIEKIIRKKIERPDLVVSEETYTESITDLIGIRALHLFKDQWQPIHDFVFATWELHENPIAYVREGDADAVLEAFKKSGCTVQNHPFGYRSVHYLIKSQPAKHLHLTELQVRTIFEEGWSEIDHQVRYPYLSDDPHLAQFVTIFNRLAGSADEMGTFIKTLSRYLAEQGSRLADVEKQLVRKEEELKKTIGQLKISAEEKDKLNEKIAELRESSQPDRFSSITGLRSLKVNILDVSTVPYVPYISTLNMNSGSKTRVCKKCGNIFTDDSIVLLNKDKCPQCRGSELLNP